MGVKAKELWDLERDLKGLKEAVDAQIEKSRRMGLRSHERILLRIRSQIQTLLEGLGAEEPGFSI